MSRSSPSVIAPNATRCRPNGRKRKPCTRKRKPKKQAKYCVSSSGRQGSNLMRERSLAHASGFVAIGNQGGYMSRVIHFEIHAENPERAVAFYRSLFGWEFK